MKIQFCDLCNESVPQADIDEGRAFIRKGRVVCAACDKAMSQPSADALAGAPSHAPAAGADAAVEAAPAQASPTAFSSILAAQAPLERPVEVQKSRAGLWVAVLAMAFTAAAIFVQNRRLEEAAIENRSTRELARRGEQELLEKLHGVEGDLQRLVAEQEKNVNARLDAQRNDLSAQLSRWQSEQGQQSNAIRDELKKLSQSGSDMAKQTSEDQRRRDELSQRIAKGEDDVHQLLARLDKLEQAAKAPPPAPVPVAANEPAWKSLLVDLTSANAGVRWEAVDGLGQARDPQAVPSLLPMLKDPDVFVRMATARVLGDLKSPAAMPALLDALEDSEDAVREAAFVAMRAIVGNKELKFDPLAPEAERAKRLKALREWWKKEEESGAGRG